MIELHLVGALFGIEGVHKFASLSSYSHHSGNWGGSVLASAPLNKCELPRNQTVSLSMQLHTVSSRILLSSKFEKKEQLQIFPQKCC